MELDGFFKAMPPARRVRFWHVPLIWYENAQDRKLINDWLALAAKILPYIIIFTVPILIITAIWFYQAVLENYKTNPILFWIVLSCITTIVVITTFDIRNDRLFEKN
jgi:hypothetical protein